MGVQVFSLEPEEKRDVSFFKLIVTTSPIDLSSRFSIR
jgi:hypothetical protein